MQLMKQLPLIVKVNALKIVATIIRIKNQAQTFIYKNFKKILLQLVQNKPFSKISAKRNWANQTK